VDHRRPLRALGVLREDGDFGRLQNAVQTTQDREGQDDLAIVRLLVVAAQKVGDGPDEGRKGIGGSLGGPPTRLGLSFGRLRRRTFSISPARGKRYSKYCTGKNGHSETKDGR
jgi:hypothetical protein